MLSPTTFSPTSACSFDLTYSGGILLQTAGSTPLSPSDRRDVTYVKRGFDHRSVIQQTIKMAKAQNALDEGNQGAGAP